jgi:hypothetical protein
MRARQKSLGQTTETILKDLKLFGSLCIAQFIVWGTMRRNRKGTRDEFLGPTAAERRLLLQ